MAVTDTLPKEQIAYLEQMLRNNVLWWGIPSDWDKMLQYEIIDRGLVTKDGPEHTALVKLLNKHRSGL